ncbi:AsmA family protein [Aureimonas phyllosphaerae]|uniref:AsmA protein n=1 Tax=Aureimonas phyllosphaerae TaxID=1166078 RepID=A0A7W6BUD0_9HYPH|nr:AsmA-like C-terminal region-containing protein [Aureimonas phyllosphaerae]MBB3936440.1 hypothetical protein [Aureimonas phyllosphaerae]MBB3960696.1 hypothetical protein [Aureimonas phyllosphaerae]SFF30223.1 Uncharacterized protein involved in outer membrane biogenesis [Aureimonas phyllosphaerae]
MTPARDPSPRVPTDASPRRRGVKRSLAIGGVAALVLGGGLVAAFSTFPLTLPAAQAEIEARLGRLVGAPVSVAGTAEFSLLPRPSVILSDVRAVTSADGAALQLDVDRLEADFNLLDALAGRAEIRRVTMVRPELGPADPATLSPPGSPSAGTPPAAAVPAPPTPAGGREAMRALLARFQGVNELRLRDGLVRLPGMDSPVSSADIDFRWNGDGASANLSGSFVWNGQPAKVQGQLDRPVPFFDGETSPLRLVLSGPSGEVSFSGEGSGRTPLQLSGLVRLATPSLSRAARWLGEPSVPDLGALALETRIELSGERLNFGAVQLDLGGNQARGALEADLSGTAGRRSLSGTLAFSDLDLGRAFQAIAPIPRNVLDLQRPMHFALGRDLDIDLRLSAERAQLGPVAASELAAAIKVVGGAGTLDIGDMAALGGRGGLRLRFASTNGHPSVDASLRLSAVSMTELDALSGVPLPVSAGSGDLDVSFRGPAASWGDLLANGRSTLSLRVSDGRMRGFANELMRASGRHEIEAGTASAAQGFQSLTASLEGFGTRMRLDTLSMTTTAGKSEARGVLDAYTRRLNLFGTTQSSVVEASGASEAFTSSQPIPFTIQGEWPRPVMTVDAPEAPI